ncbi:MAG: glycoside hydrolase family 3 C-terminal domain-containing protein [Labilibaculum sp.]|nr:glycoside hydrolase family 3 C-terminal domain-containing protein [Labilibaculum sp.]
MCNKLFLLLFITLVGQAQCQEYNHFPQLSGATISDVVEAMSLEEKALIVVGAGLHSQIATNENGIIGDVKGRVQGATGSTNGLPKFGIPQLIMSDGPAGLRIDPIRDKDSTKTYYATAWPVGILIASFWDTTLIQKVGKALGNEVKEYGIDVHLAPGMNLIRDLLNGRNFEYFSEDPFVSGRVGAAYVKGIQSNGVGSTIKHFVANNQESNRLNVNVNVSERALRELYLKGFEIAIKEAKPLYVMSSYNKVNGTYTPESYDLLTKILRNEWGFEGCVVTDWGGGRDDVAQMKAGNDLIMPGADSKRKAIIDAVKNGTLEMKILDENVARILHVIIQSPSYKNYHFSNSPDLDDHAKLARVAVAESIILLKNDNNILPISQNSKVALFGCASYDTYSGGTGSGEVYSKYKVTIAEGLKNQGFENDQKLESVYLTHIEQDKIDFPRPKKTLGKVRMTPEKEFSMVDIEKAAIDNDFAIITIGRVAGEGKDVEIEEGFNLNELEKKQIKSISEVFHAKGKKLIVIINSGNTIETASWRDYADAILLPWMAGQESGNAIADVLTGSVNPSGKLTVTFPIKYEDVSSSNNFPGIPERRPKEVTYEEGIYVGYRYFNTFNVKPAYEFGYGLSYTRFEYSRLKLSSSKFDNELKVEVTVKNTGKVAGKEIVQLYLSAPAKNIDKPSAELKGFVKTVLLKPGESQTLTMTLRSEQLASFITVRSAWIAEAGDYQVNIGASSEDIKLSKSFTLNNELEVEKVNKVFVPQVQINELKHN